MDILASVGKRLGSKEVTAASASEALNAFLADLPVKLTPINNPAVGRPSDTLVVSAFSTPSGKFETLKSFLKRKGFGFKDTKDIMLGSLWYKTIPDVGVINITYIPLCCILTVVILAD